MRSNADNWDSFSAFAFRRLSTIEVKPFTLRSARLISTLRSDSAFLCWTTCSSILVHSSDRYRRYSSVLRCLAPVSETLRPRSSCHFSFTCESSSCNIFILAENSYLSFPANIFLNANLPSWIGNKVRCICGVVSSRCT